MITKTQVRILPSSVTKLGPNCQVRISPIWDGLKVGLFKLITVVIIWNALMMENVVAWKDILPVLMVSVLILTNA